MLRDIERAAELKSNSSWRRNYACPGPWIAAPILDLVRIHLRRTKEPERGKRRQVRSCRHQIARVRSVFLVSGASSARCAMRCWCQSVVVYIFVVNSTYAGVEGKPAARATASFGPSSAKRCCQRQTIGRLTAASGPRVAPAGDPPKQALPGPVQYNCAAGCDPSRSSRAAFCPTCSTTRILSVSSTQIRTPLPPVNQQSASYAQLIFRRD